jgi:hypothetical protein
MNLEKQKLYFFDNISLEEAKKLYPPEYVLEDTLTGKPYIEISVSHRYEY